MAATPARADEGGYPAEGARQCAARDDATRAALRSPSAGAAAGRMPSSVSLYLPLSPSTSLLPPYTSLYFHLQELQPGLTRSRARAPTLTLTLTLTPTPCPNPKPNLNLNPIPNPNPSPNPHRRSCSSACSTSPAHRAPTRPPPTRRLALTRAPNQAWWGAVSCATSAARSASSCKCAQVCD